MPRPNSDGVKRGHTKAERAAYGRWWYNRNHTKELTRGRTITARMREWCRHWKSVIGCITCGEHDPVCLEFHHLDPRMKRFGVQEASHYGDEARIAELQKCVVVCANCHLKAHELLKPSPQENKTNG